MQTDTLRLLNTSLVKTISVMDDEELWNFYLENEEWLKFRTEWSNNVHPKTGILYAYRHGIEHFRKHFENEIDEDREGVIYTTVLDFCFGDEKVRLDYWAQGGYLDNADSCNIKTSDEIMPPVDEDSEAGCKSEFFHLLEPHHVANIIRAMEKNIEKTDDITPEKIEQVKAMREHCLNNEGYKIAYIYDRI